MRSRSTVTAVWTANGTRKCCSVFAASNGSMRSALVVWVVHFSAATGITKKNKKYLITCKCRENQSIGNLWLTFKLCAFRFYVFVCSMCNYGKEFVRRLELKWVDLVHLMLYNLTVYNAKKYYDLDTRIVPFTNENWHYLELPDSVSV